MRTSEPRGATPKVACGPKEPGERDSTQNKTEISFLAASIFPVEGREWSQTFCVEEPVCKVEWVQLRRLKCDCRGSSGLSFRHQQDNRRDFSSHEHLPVRVYLGVQELAAGEHDSANPKNLCYWKSYMLHRILRPFSTGEHNWNRTLGCWEQHSCQ